MIYGIKVNYQGTSVHMKIPEKIQFFEFAGLIRNTFRISPDLILKIQYVTRDAEFVTISSDFEFNMVKSLSEYSNAYFTVNTMPLPRSLSFKGQMYNVIKDIGVQQDIESLETPDDTVPLLENATSNENFRKCDEYSPLLYKSEKLSNIEYSDFLIDLSNDSLEELFYSFEISEEEDEKQAEVSVRSIGTETNDLLFPKENFIVQTEKTTVSRELMSCEYFHPNTNTVKLMQSMKSYVENIIEKKKQEIIREYLIERMGAMEDTPTEYEEAELIIEDDCNTLVPESDDDDKTLVLDISEQTPYVPRQVTFLPLVCCPLSNTISMKMPTQFGSWTNDDDDEWLDVMELGYE